jgi:hypothetical protein
MRRHLGLSMITTVGLLALVPGALAADTCDHHRFYSTKLVTDHGKRAQRHTYQTTLTTDQVRVFRQRGFVGAASYLCARRNGHLHRLGVDTGAGAAASDVTLTDLIAVGPILGYDTQTRGDVDQDRFRSIDALNGRTVADSHNVPDEPGAAEPEFAMTRSGDLGWIVAGTAGVADARGARTVSTPGGGPANALAVGTSTAYFMQAGVPHAVPLF